MTFSLKKKIYTFQMNSFGRFQAENRQMRKISLSLYMNEMIKYLLSTCFSQLHKIKFSEKYYRNFSLIFFKLFLTMLNLTRKLNLFL